MAKRRKIHIKTSNGDSYTTDGTADSTAKDMAVALLYAPMMVATNTKTDKKEVLMTNHIVSYTFADGLGDADFSGLAEGMQEDDAEDFKERMMKEVPDENTSIH